MHQLNFPDPPAGAVGWFCVRTQPKHEHLAAASLRQNFKIEVFLPRVRFRRPTRQGPAWVTEALFANYLFARFELAACLRQVQHARGVRGLVRFGNRWPTVPEQSIAELRAAFGNDELRVINNEFTAGEVVEIKGGAFHGLEALVTRAFPAKQRVAVLLDFLGRQTAVELAEEQLVKTGGSAARWEIGC